MIRQLDQHLPSEELPEVGFNENSDANDVIRTYAEVTKISEERPGDAVPLLALLKEPLQDWFSPDPSYEIPTLEKGITNKELYDIVDKVTDVTATYPVHVGPTFDKWTDDILGWYDTTSKKGSTSGSRATTPKGVRFERTPSPVPQEEQYTPLPPQITRGARARWELFSSDQQKKIWLAFENIHGKLDRQTKDVLNWWNELDEDEKETVFWSPE